MNGLRTELYRAGLVRSIDQRVLGGVCGGLARRVGVTPFVMRLIVVLSMILLPGSQLLLYPLAWWLMPDETFVPAPVPPVTPGQVPPSVPPSGM
ncbi:MAG TPA: PspC domain-containing protein [Dermatophilaceae bacterium]|nr:PspC domain-containing protein [Dermatophilaceae bacterium]